MKIRKLRFKDAPLMLEWMHDDSVIRDMKTDFASKTLDDCLSFIKQSHDDSNNLHLAIVDDTNTYMGTVSLKHISCFSAELGIVVRKCAMGKGFSEFGIKNIIEKGFKQLRLKNIFWCVSPQNQRALKFYDNNKYQRSSIPKEAKDYYTVEELQHYIWYEVVS